MSCKFNPNEKAVDNAFDYLVNQGLVNFDNFEIFDLQKFKEVEAEITKKANEAYYLDNLHYFTYEEVNVAKASASRNTTSRTDRRRTYNKIVVVDKAFKQVDDVRKALGIYDSKETIGSYRSRMKKQQLEDSARSQQKLDSKRAGEKYTDSYLFNKDLQRLEYQDPTGEIELQYKLDSPLRDTQIRTRFFSDGDTQTVKSILDKIINEEGQYAELAQHLKTLVVVDIPVELLELDYVIGIDPNGKSFRAGGQYNPSTANRINEKIIMPEGAGVLNNDSAYTLMHEIIHALTYRTLENKNQYVNTEERDAFIDAYIHAKNYFKNNPSYKPVSQHFEYGLQDVHEFMTALLTDPKFMQDMMNVPMSITLANKTKDWKNFFDEIISKLLAMLGIKSSEPFYNQAVKVASHVLQTQNYIESNELVQEKLRQESFDFERGNITQDDLFDSPFAKEQISDVQMNLQNLELTNEVIDYLYNDSNQRLSKENYTKEVYKLATNLKGSLSKEEVVEKLKCL